MFGLPHPPAVIHQRAVVLGERRDLVGPTGCAHQNAVGQDQHIRPRRPMEFVVELDVVYGYIGHRFSIFVVSFQPSVVSGVRA